MKMTRELMENHFMNRAHEMEKERQEYIKIHDLTGAVYLEGKRDVYRKIARELEKFQTYLMGYFEYEEYLKLHKNNEAE